MKAEPDQAPSLWAGLSIKLIVTIITVILAAEVLIYLPSVANFRAVWLEDRLSVASVAAQVLDVVPDDMELPEELVDRLLNSAGAMSIAYRRGGRNQLIQIAGNSIGPGVVTIDMHQRGPIPLISGALETLFQGSDRILRVVGPVPGDKNARIEVLISEAPLRAAMLIYSRNIFVLSLLVAVITAAAIFIFINFVVIRPVRQLAANMMAFRRAPENATLIVTPTDRGDEIGIAERELSAMEHDLFAMLRQRRHLAELGLAVAKINHDLRNTLTSAQLLSDQVATLDDPNVQRLAPRLVQTLDRAIGFTQSVLEYGRQSSTPPDRQPVDLHALVDEAALDAGLRGHPGITWANNVPDAINLMVDPDQMARVFVNLTKNAREALEAEGTRTEQPEISVGYEDRGDDGLAIIITDNGPGLPPRARENLFVAFEGSARAGGTGLGLAIARELTEAHGGTLTLVVREKGTQFEICLPRAARAI